MKRRVRVNGIEGSNLPFVANRCCRRDPVWTVEGMAQNAQPQPKGEVGYGSNVHVRKQGTALIIGKRAGTVSLGGRALSR